MKARPARRISGLAALCALVAAMGVVGVTTEAVAPAPAYALDDGLARTPPMGFNNWNDTFCGPDFNEEYVKATADLIASTGLKDAGYEYVNLDDCWARPQNSPQGSRDAQGHLVPDPVRFPNGIDAVADYVHAQGLKLGIYSDAGTRTCNGRGFDGMLGPGWTAGDPTFETTDAQDFADWGVDYVKFDWCNVPLGEVPGDTVQEKARLLYTKMSEALRATGRPMVFSIATLGDSRVRPWEWGAEVGHLGRTTGDIRANYASMSDIAKFNLTLSDFAGPGYWNDPDMLQVGNAPEQGGSWSLVEQRTHFSLWAMMAAPLLIGTDLRNATRQTLSILRNRDVIAVDQDRSGIQGEVVRFDEDGAGGGHYVIAKPLEDGDVAVALWNDTATAARITTSASEVEAPPRDRHLVRDLWTKHAVISAGEISAVVPAHGTAMFRITAVPPQR
jgi:alpha-galactosidase